MISDVRVACFYMHARRVGTVNLDAEEHQNRVATLCMRVYLLGGPVEKMSFFQIAPMTKVSTQIHLYMYQYDVYKVS